MTMKTCAKCLTTISETHVFYLDGWSRLVCSKIRGYTTYDLCAVCLNAFIKSFPATPETRLLLVGRPKDTKVSY